MADPVTSVTYAITRVGNYVTKETWTTTATSKLLKSIDYTYTLEYLTGETRKAFAADGVTIIGQLDIAYTLAGSLITGAVFTRTI